MRIYVKSSKEITNDYLNELFKKIDWNDVDYADRMIDKIIKKHLSVDRVFDQAKYINMLDEDVKNELMYLLEHPEELHDRRMKGRKKSRSKSSPCVLKVKYEDYPDGNIRVEEYDGSNRVEALKKMVDGLLIYLDVDTIEDDNMTSEDIINEIEMRNGDGCDYIINLKDETTGQILMDYPYEGVEYF